MSRTIRRTNEKKVFFWFETETEFNYYKGKEIRWTRNMLHNFDSYDKYVEYETAIFHSDSGYSNHFCGGGVPRWFVNAFCTRPLRRKHKEQIHRALEMDSWDDMILEPFKHNAAYSYW